MPFRGTSLLRRGFRDHALLSVLLLLSVLFSVLTWGEQHPQGAEAGAEVARALIADGRTSVLVAARKTEDDAAFSATVVAELKGTDVGVVGVVNGEVRDVRVAIDRVLAGGGRIDAVAANNVTGAWTVYDRYPEIGRQKCVMPKSYNWPAFLKPRNLINIARQTAVYAIIAIGMTMVIISGGIDLSVGSLVALGAVSLAAMLRAMGGTDASLAAIVTAAVGAVLMCGASGVFVGVVTTRYRVAPFITTLAIMLMASGLAWKISGGESIDTLPKDFFYLGSGEPAGVPVAVWLMIVLYGLGWYVMSRTVFGRYIYAIGGNERAAELSGVPVHRVIIAVYAVCGALAGLCGVILASQLRAGDPKFGMLYELDVIAAVVVGGTSLMGGRGSVAGTLLGAFVISMIKNGMNLTDVDPYNQKIVLGSVLLLAALLDCIKRKSSD